MRRNVAAVIALGIVVATVLRAPQLGFGGVVTMLVAAFAAFYAVSAYDAVLEQRRAFASLAGEVRSMLRELAERQESDARRAERLAARDADAHGRRAEEFVLDAMARELRG